MKARRTVIFLVALLTIGTLAIGLLLQNDNIPLLQTKGSIGDQQRDLIILGASLSLIVVLPVFAMLFGFIWRYREDNTKASYRPNWDGSRLAESVWWGVPLLLIGFLSIVTWQATHRLDPFRPIESAQQPLTVQVVALEWKWLFIYPEQGIATVNHIKFPADTPVDFRITADAPMNSFWIPALGGQMYAMSGMSTQLHLIANQPGTYRGSSANLSGAGFAGMHFSAQATSTDEFATWVSRTKAAGTYLSQDVYEKLAKPSSGKVATYAAADPELYDSILSKYTLPRYGTETNAKHENGGTH